MKLADFDYPLPPELIAQAPLPVRTASRLLVVDERGLIDSRFDALAGFLRPGDLLVFNDTRVLHARLVGVKESGGKVEVLIERPLSAHEALAQIRASHAPHAGSRLVLEGALEVEVLGRDGEFYRLRFVGEDDLITLLERHGKLPLPPYIQRAAGEADEARYQTVYARARGSVAAPTAGLHFDDALLQRLAARGLQFAWLTLHVGAGTFQPVRVGDLSEHKMHSERYHLPSETVNAILDTRAKGGRIVCIGTTSLRTLEAAWQGDEPKAGSGETDLFILPGHHFKSADMLITNFHLPKSTLLMLVSAFAGVDTIRRAYAHAIAEHYRFFSYGDAMLLTRAEGTS